MSQHNTPGNDPNDGRDESQSQHGAGNGAPDSPTNPYFGRAEAQPAPDLDASAPTLRSAEEQRLNRKALVFMGGILLLLIGVGYMVFHKSRKDEGPVAVRETARAATPELPNFGPAAQPQVQTQADPIPMLPALPQDQDQTRLVPIAPPEPMMPRGPTLLDRRIAGSDDAASAAGNRQAPQRSALDEATRQALLANLPGAQTNEAGKVRRGPDVEDVSNASFIRSPDALLVRGTYLRCVLETRIITDYAGFTSCLLTEPVYSINGRSLLLPKGSKIYGSYGGRPTGKRVEVIWDRITTPNGLDVAMSSPGIDGLGSAGHPGQYDAHWGARIGSALMISLIADAFKYAAAQNGPETTTVTGSGLAVQSPYESATARTMERLAGEALSERSPPTVTINQGTMMNVYVAKDVDFSDVLAQRR